jgi:Tfp pilus assembly protein PilX
LKSRRCDASGAALGVVLWALVALGALALAAALSARVETALAHNYRDHAAALALAEAGLAEALAREAAEPGSDGVGRSVEGTLETGEWVARWTPDAGRFAIQAEGRSGRATRVVEAWIERGGVLSPRVVAWREVR